MNNIPREQIKAMLLFMIQSDRRLAGHTLNEVSLKVWEHTDKCPLCVATEYLKK